MASVLALAVVALFALSAESCMIPPGGCTSTKCATYSNMKVPPSGNYSDVAYWGSPYNNLAYIRESFNKNLMIGGVEARNGPVVTDAAGWVGLLSKYDSPYNGAGTPSLNYEWFEVGGATVYAAPNVSITSGGIQSCCDQCRAMLGCTTYFFVPSSYTGGSAVTAGTCSFISSGANTNEGPYVWDTPHQRGTTPIGSPKSLGATASTAVKVSGGATYVLGFLGGSCNGANPTNVTDDPHFTGAHGTRFDFNGELNKAFCLVTDRKLHLNVVLKGYKTQSIVGTTVSADTHPIRSWIKEVGLIWADSQNKQHTLHLVARSGAETARGAGFLAAASVDGQAIVVPQVAGSSVQAADLTFSFIGTTKKGWYDLDQFRVVIPGQMDMGLSMRVAHPKLRTPTDAEVHFNLMFNDVKVTPSVHGVLGQTYRETSTQIMKAVKYSALNRLMGAPVKADGTTGAGFLEGGVADYESSDVLKADCKVSAFSA